VAPLDEEFSRHGRSAFLPQVPDETAGHLAKI
jgi:hypothetical protein